MVLALSPRARRAAEREPAQGFPLSIIELSGDGRAIVLTGRSLPYRPVAWTGELRVETKYFPGNPIAQAQVMGAVWGETTMNGKWKDVFLSNVENAAQLRGFPPTAGPDFPGTRGFGGKSFQSGGAVNNGAATRARELRDAFWLLQRAGQLLRVEWGSIVRYGFLTSFEADHDREEDIGYTLQWRWIGDTDAVPRVRVAPKLDAPGLLAQLLKDIQDFITELQTELAFFFGRAQEITQAITRVGSLVTEVVDTLSSVVNALLIPAQIIGTLTQQLTSVALAVKNLLDELRAVPAGYAALRDGGNVLDANIAAGIQAQLAFNAARLGVESITVRDQLQEFDIAEALGVYTATSDTTLRDVSNLAYGTPDNWPFIADFNGLTGSVVPQGAVLKIPALGQSEGRGGSLSG